MRTRKDKRRTRKPDQDDIEIEIAEVLYGMTPQPQEQRIIVFKDDADLPRGNIISKELFLGIKSSTISIIIFSKDYAGSRWCLNELSKIMELHRAQGQVVLPVFYGVDPSEVRNQNSSFGEAFRYLLKRSSPTKDQVSKWTTDLIEVGGIAGFVVLNSK